MDVCTILFGSQLMTMVPAVGCIKTMDVCHPNDEGTKMMCLPGPCETTRIHEIQWVCKRDDGSTYNYSTPNYQGMAR